MVAGTPTLSGPFAELQQLVCVCVCVCVRACVCVFGVNLASLEAQFVLVVVLKGARRLNVF